MIKKSFKSHVSILLAIVIVLSTIIIPNVVNIKANADTISELYMQDFEGVNPLSDYIKGSDLSSAEIVAEKNNPQNNVIKFDREGNDDTSIQSALYKIFEVKPNTNYVFTVDANVTDKKENASSLTMWQGCGLSVHGVTYSGDVPSFGKDFANPTNIKCDGNGLTTYENNDGTGVVHFNIAKTNNWNTYTLSFNSGENNYVAIAWHIIYSRAEVMLDNVSLKQVTSNFVYNFNDGIFPNDLTMGSKASNGLTIVDKGDGDKAVQLDFTTLGGATQVTFDYGFYKIIPVNPNTNYTYSFDAKITNSRYDLPEHEYINGYRGGAFFVGGASNSNATPSECTSLLDNANNVCYDGVNWKSTELYIDNPNGVIAPDFWGYKVGFGTTAEEKWHNYSVTFNSGDNEYIVVANFIIYADDVVLGLDNISLKEKSYDFECDFESADSINEFTKGNNLNSANLVDINNLNTNKAVKISKSSGDSTSDRGSTSINSSLYRIFEVTPNTNYIFSIDANVTDRLENADSLNMWQGCGISVRGVTYSESSQYVGKNFALETNVKYDDSSLTTYNNSDGDGVIHLETPKTNEWHTYTLSFNSGENSYVAIAWHIIYSRAVVMLDNVKLELDPIQPAPVGTIFNGDFETGNVLPFEKTGANTKIEIATTEGTNGTDTYVGKISSSADYTGLTSNSVKSGNILIEKNKYYTLSFDLKLINFAKNPDGTNKNWANGGVYLTAGDKMLDLSGWSDGNFAEMNGDNWWIISTNDNEWHKYELSFSSGDNTEIVFNYFNLFASASAYIDNIKLIETEPPKPPVVGEVTNGDFEDGNVLPFASTGGNTKIEIAKTKGPDGTNTYVGKITSSANYTSLTSNSVKSGNILIEKNKYYKLSFDLKLIAFDKKADGSNKNFANGGVYLTAGDKMLDLSGWSDGNFAEMSGDNWWIISTNDNEWHKYELSFSSGDNTEIVFNYFNLFASASAYIDNIKLTESKPPVVGEITNGDFEDGNVLPFVSLGANTKIEIATTKGPNGTNTYAGKITSAADYASLSSNSVKRDNILIEKNKYYTLSFDLKLINFAKNPDGTNKNWANGGVYLTAGDKMLDLSGWSDGNFAEMSGDNWWIISTNDNEWHKYKLTFYADNVTNIAFNYFNLFASASAYIDNIKIIETDASLIPSKDNLINSSFENTEDFYPYNLSDQIKVNITDIEHSDGKYSLKCEGNGTVSQTVEVEPYTYYEWFIDVKINKAAKGKFDIEKNNLSVACLGTFNGNGKPIWSTISGTKAYPQTFNDGYNQLLWTTDVWETYRVSFYTDEHTSIKLTYYNKQDTVAFIDNLRLVRGDTVAKRDELTGTQIIFNNFDNEYASAYGIGLNKTDSAFISKTDSYSGNQCAVLQPSKLGEVNLIAYKDRYYSTQNVSIKNMEVGKVYRLSCYAKLNFDCDDYTMEFRLSPYNSAYQTYKYIVSQEWKKYELIFTPTQEEYGFNILNINYDNYLSASDTLYIDDICLEVVENEIISTNVDNTYSFELTNAIKNGNFEYEFTDNDWLEMGDSIKRIEDEKQAFIGKAYANISGTVNYEKVLNIKPGKVYTFAVSLRSNSENSNFKIGIVSEEGKPFALKDDKNVTSFFSAPALGDGWQRFAITLLPTNDKVKLVIVGDNIDIDIDALVFAIPEATTKTDKNIYDISTHDDTVLNAKIAGIAQEMSGWLWGIIGGVALLTSAIGIVVIIYFKKRRAKK